MNLFKKREYRAPSVVTVQKAKAAPKVAALKLVRDIAGTIPARLDVLAGEVERGEVDPADLDWETDLVPTPSKPRGH